MLKWAAKWKPHGSGPLKKDRATWKLVAAIAALLLFAFVVCATGGGFLAHRFASRQARAEKRIFGEDWDPNGRVTVPNGIAVFPDSRARFTIVGFSPDERYWTLKIFSAKESFFAILDMSAFPPSKVLHFKTEDASVTGLYWQSPDEFFFLMTPHSDAQEGEVARIMRYATETSELTTVKSYNLPVQFLGASQEELYFCETTNPDIAKFWVLNAASGEELLRCEWKVREDSILKGPDDVISQYAWIPQSRQIAALATQRVDEKWKTLAVCVFDLDSCQRVEWDANLIPAIPAERIGSIKFTPDGTIAAIQVGKGTVKLADWKSKNVLATIELGEVDDIVQITPTKLLITGYTANAAALTNRERVMADVPMYTTYAINWSAQRGS